MSKPERLSRSTIYENPWVNLYVDRVRFPEGRTLDHHVLEFDKEAVAVLVENAQQQLLFVQAYRYVTDSVAWEIPAGGIDQGESILAAAEREVYEESGYETSDHELFYTYYPMNGIANKVFHLVRCRAVRKSGEFDKNEIKATRWVTRPEIRAMILQQQIQDGYTLTGVLLDLASEMDD